METEIATTPVEETTETTAPVVETNIESQVTKPVETQEEKLDYVALYEKEKEKLAKAEYSLYKKNKEERLKREQREETGYVDTDEVKKLVAEEVSELVQVQRMKDSEDVFTEELSNITIDPDRQRLIRFKYDNAIIKTGFSRLAIRSDLGEAAFLADKPKYLKEKSEMAQTILSKKSMTNTSIGTNQDKPVPLDDLSKHFSKQDWEFMQKRKWSEDQIRKAYEIKKFS